MNINIATPELAIRICNLYSLQLGEIDRSWMSNCGLLDESAKLKHPDLLSGEISNSIQKSLDLSEVECINKIDPIFLLKKDELQELLIILGSIQLHENISHVILSSELKALKEIIGGNIYNFTLTKGRLYSLPSDENIEITDALIKRNTLLRAGIGTLIKILDKPSKGIEQRFWLKLPKSLAKDFNQSHTTDVYRNQIIRILRECKAKCLPLLR